MWVRVCVNAVVTWGLLVGGCALCLWDSAGDAPCVNASVSRGHVTVCVYVCVEGAWGGRSVEVCVGPGRPLGLCACRPAAPSPGIPSCLPGWALRGQAVSHRLLIMQKD